MRRQFGWPLPLIFGMLRLATTSFWAKAMRGEKPGRRWSKRSCKCWRNGKAIPIRELDGVAGYSGMRLVSRSMQR
jgi:hypothetical protein